MVSRFMSNPGSEHQNAVKWILWYLKGTSSMCLLRFGSRKPQLNGQKIRRNGLENWMHHIYFIEDTTWEICGSSRFTHYNTYDASTYKTFFCTHQSKLKPILWVRRLTNYAYFALTSVGLNLVNLVHSLHAFRSQSQCTLLIATFINNVLEHQESSLNSMAT